MVLKVRLRLTSTLFPILESFFMSVSSSSVHIRRTVPGDGKWIKPFIVKYWGAEKVIAHGTVFYPHTLQGFAAIQKDEKIGLVTFYLKDDYCEIVTLNSIRPHTGVGSRLVEAVKKAAGQAGCKRLWLITTNDNINALRFYQKRGFELAALHRNALDLSRKLKPEIPLTGDHGIPLRDEIELEIRLIEK